MQITIKTDFSGVQRKLNALSENLQAKVIPAAINKVGDKARAEMVRQITGEFNIRPAEVRSRLRLIRASKKLEKWYATLDPFALNRRGRSMNLIHFVEKSISLAEGRRRKKAGTQNQLRFQVKKIGGKKIIEGAFLANNGRTVFVRVGKDRLPIKPVQVIDVPQMFNARRVIAAVVAKIGRDLETEFDRAIKAAISGALR